MNIDPIPSSKERENTHTLPKKKQKLKKTYGFDWEGPGSLIFSSQRG
jgi:hypothetical protein